jgi:outer membrane PBP1 activator LpoA protein
MRLFVPPALSALTTLLALSLCLVLSACQSPPRKPAGSHATPATQDQVEYLLSNAETAPPREKMDLKLQAALLLVERGDLDWARSIINNLPEMTHSFVPPELAARLALVKSHTAAAEGLIPLAYSYLDDPQLLANREGLPSDLAQAITRLRAELLFDMALYPSSAAERVLLADMVIDNEEASRENANRLWSTLMAIPLPELESLAQQPDNSRDLQGWYRLALLSKDTQTNLREQLAQLDLWLLNWPDHPASLQLPADLQLLRQLVEEQPRQVALLLPFTGQLSGAANAIRDGFMAAFYQAQQLTGEVPSLRFYDTHQADIHALYEQAVSDGAQLVIGPLTKENLQELALLPALPVPTLALNTVDNPLGVVPNLYQFGLGVEDEAQQAAERAWRDGHRRALILAPDSAWGDRSVEAFISRWRSLGGEVIRDFRFAETKDYSKLIKQALLLEDSERRAREIRNLVGNIEFEPRRRRDVDVIFLAAQAGQARQIKPTLAFHYATDVPVYATSQVYTGRPEPKLDQDMNGIRFSTLPWYFERRSQEKQSLEKSVDGSPALQPLYAMGVDCFHLYPRLKQLEAVKQANFYGHTGQLQLDEQHQFRRQQIWAEFTNGRPRPLAEALQ